MDETGSPQVERTCDICKRAFSDDDVVAADFQPGKKVVLTHLACSSAQSGDEVESW